MSLSAAVIGVRLYHLQIVSSEKLRARATQQQQSELEVPATRGAILDRQGRELALSLKTASLFAHPRRVADPEHAARSLAPIIRLSRSEILNRLRSEKTFVYLDSNSQIFTKSEAVIEILKSLGGYWKLASIGKILPLSFRNTLYDSVAKRRRELISKESCPIPTEDQRSRILP